MKAVTGKIDRKGRGVLKAISASQGPEAALPREYQTIFKNNGKPMVIIDDDTTISLANAEFARLSGYTKKEIEGTKKWTEFVARQDRRRMKEYHLLRKSDPMLAPRCCEFRFVDRHGKIKNIVLTIGQIPGTTKNMASLQDVTDRRQAEVTQRASEERYQTFFENSRDAVYITTSDGVYVDANHAALDLFGYTREEMKKVKARLLYADSADAMRLRREIEKKGFVQDFEVRLRKKDATEMDCLFTVTALRGDDGSILEYQGIARDVTERKRAVEALRKSEEKYRDIFDSMLEGYFEVDLAGNFLFFNKAVSKFFGCSRDALMGLNYQEFTSPEGAQRLYQVFLEVYKTGNPHEIDDYEIIKKDGSIGIAEFSVSLLRNASGETIGFRGVTRDVTEKRKIQMAFGEKEEKYRAILETIEDGYYELDLTGNFTFVNDAVCRHLGYAKEELIGMNNRRYTSPETAKKIYEIFNAIYKKGESTNVFDYEAIRKDGTTITLEISASLMRDKKGEPVGFRGISRDITERKQAEETLRQSEERYRTILETMQDAYFEVDLAGRFTFVNDAQCRITGSPRERLIGMSNRQYTDETTAKTLYEIFHEIYRTGEPVTAFAFEYIKRDGTKAFNELSASLIRNAQGKPIGFRGISRDVTERKRSEEALRKSEEKYRTILESIAEGYFENDLHGNLTFVNNSLLEIYGYTRDELLKLNYRQFMDEENVQKVFQAYNKAYTTGKPEKEIQYEIIRKDGTRRYLDNSVSPVRSADGTTVGFRGIARDITERKKVEEALRQSEEKYRTILASIEDGYAEFDLQGKITFFNNALPQILGYPTDELKNLDYKNRQYMEKEDAEKVYETFTEVYATGKPRRGFQYGIITQDGTKRYLEGYISLRKDADNQPVGFQGLARDITERKQAEEQLRQSEERYRSILDILGDAYTEMDLAGHTTYINKESFKFLEYPEEEFVGMSYKDYTTPENAKKLFEIYNKVYKTGEPARFVEHKLLAKDGTTRIVESTVELRRDKAGKPIGFRTITRNITQKKQIEEALRKSEERYRGILENMQEAYYETDFAGHLAFVNDAICQHLGYSKEELIGKKSRYFQDEINAQKITQAFTGIHRTGEPVKAVEAEYIRKDGTKGTYELSASLIKDAQGKPIGFRGVSRDVTERKKAEEQLKRYAAELERSNEEVKNFAYIVSHDLRVPLVNLKGYTSELRSALGVIGANFDAALPHLIDEKRSEVAMALHEDVPEALEFITNSVSRMDSFINSILILSRLGRQDLKPEPVDMNALVKTAFETMSHQIQERGIEVHVGSLPHVVADRTAMEQIVGNILSNAVKYPDSSRPCRIEVAAEVNNGETIFTIRDTGRGIAQEDMHKVFAPFRRAGKQDTQGEGMGLSYVQTLVRRHGGRIWCESELGKGTTFAFTISTTFKQGASDA